MSTRLKPMHALLAAVVASMVVMPIAFAGASGHGANAKTRKQITLLSNRVTALEGKQDPKTLPPNGPAGGDLTGTFPKPEIGPDAVGSPEIADGSVGASELKGAIAVQGTGVNVAAGTAQVASVTCPADHPRVISGGPEWGSNDNGASIIASSPSFVGNANTTWAVRGRVDTGGAANQIFAEALCIA